MHSIIENNIIVSTLVLLLSINIFGFFYSFLIIRTNFFKKFKIQKRPHKIANFYQRMPLICFNLAILIAVTGTGLYLFSGSIYYLSDNFLRDLGIILFEVFIIFQSDS